MADQVKIAGKLPPHAGANGLCDIADVRRIAADPRARRLFVLAADVGETKLVHCRDEETGDEWDETVVTLRVRAIEEMGGGDEREAEQLLAAARSRREDRRVSDAMRGWEKE